MDQSTLEHRGNHRTFLLFLWLLDKAMTYMLSDKEIDPSTLIRRKVTAAEPHLPEKLIHTEDE